MRLNRHNATPGFSECLGVCKTQLTKILYEEEQSEDIKNMFMLRSCGSDFTVGLFMRHHRRKQKTDG